MKNKFKMSIGIGGPTIVMIFVIISLTTLGTLSLVTANSDLLLTEKTAKSLTDYYAADSKAELMLAQANSLPIKSNNKLTSSIPVNERQTLFVELLLTSSLMDRNKYYQIKSWKVVNNEYWNYEDYQTPYNDEIPTLY
jgi:hypothetical protein